MNESNENEQNMTKQNERINPRTKNYLKLLMVILLGVIIIDGYGSVAPIITLSSVTDEFLAGIHPDLQSSIVAFTLAISSGGMYFLFFTQYLADKLGRKKMLAITTLGMSLASLGMFLSMNYYTYVFSVFFLNFFVASDMWLLYVNEESDIDKRARNSNIILIGGVLGPVIAVICRLIFIQSDNTGWRGVTLFPMILGLIMFIVILLKVKETSKFEKIKESGMKIEKRPIKEDIKAILNMEERKSYFSLLLISFISSTTLTWALYFERYLKETGNVTPAEISIMFLLGFILSLVAFIVNALLAERIGRKPLFMAWKFLVPIGIVMWVFGALVPQNTFSIVMIGFFITHVCGVGAGGIMRIITIESLPTDRRGTGIGIRTFFTTLGGTIGLVLNGFVILIIGLGMTIIVFSFLSYLILPIAYFLVKETKSVDLDALK